MRRHLLWPVAVVVATSSVAAACVAAPPVVDPAPSNGGAPTTAASAGCGATDQRVERDIAYGPVPEGTDPNLRSLDVYTPTLPAGCPPAPVVVYVHGGGWQRGDKKAVGAKADLARAQGWVLVSVNYRLAPAVTYPTFNDDVAEAVVWARDHAADHGGDPDRIVLLGHSAGATIAASVATDERPLRRAGADLSTIRCAIPVDSAYDVVTEAGADRQIYLQAFGDDPAVWADASPLSHVAPGTGIPPFLLVTRGRDAWTAKAERLADALRGAGVPTTVVDAGAAVSHEDVNQMIGTPGDAVVTPAILDFVQRCGE